MQKNWRVTIERRDGTFYVRDVAAEKGNHATAAVLKMYREKYHEPIDGESHWIKRIVEIERATP